MFIHKKTANKVLSIIMSLIMCTAIYTVIISIGGISAMAAEGDNITIYLAGDSTVCDWDAIKGTGYYEPQAGWGQMLELYFNSDNVEVVNGAISGYSSKTFYDGCVAKSDNVKHLDELLENAKEGDYLLVQFGHNDSSKPTEEQKVSRPDVVERYVTTDQYKEYLSKYVTDAKAKGVIPVLVTPCARMSINDGKFVSSFASYVEAMKELATELDCMLIDLDAKSRAYYTELGEEGVKDVFLWCEAGMYDSYYKDGTQDKTHFQKFGAIQLARMVAEGLQENKATGLEQYMLTDRIARPENVPDAPASATVTMNKSSIFAFKWESVEDADIYLVYLKNKTATGKDLGLKLMKQTTTTAVQFSGLNKDYEFEYVVYAKNMKGESVEGVTVVKTIDASIQTDTKEDTDDEPSNITKILVVSIIGIAVLAIAVGVIIKIAKASKKKK